MNDENLIFLSASEYGSYQTAARTWGHATPWTQDGFVPTDFAGMNTNVYEPVDPSSNTLGYPRGTGLSEGVPAYRNDAFVTHLVMTAWNRYYLAPSTMFNSLILHRQGPYGWPTWKQIRVGSHPISRFHRKNNIFSYSQKTSTGVTQYEEDHGKPGTDKITSTVVSFNLTESCVSDKHKPLVSSFIVTQGKNKVNLDLRHSYGNLKEHYTSDKINSVLVFPNNFQENVETIYESLKDIYINKVYLHELGDVSADDLAANPYGMIPYKKWINMIYAENVFPKQKNTFLLKTRQRTQYAEVAGLGSNGYDRRDFRTFWKDTLTDRNLRTPEVALNSQGYPVLGVNSVWSLDTDLPTGSGPSYGYRNIVGELQTGLSYTAPEATISAWYPYTASIILHRVPTRHEKAESRGLDQWVYGIPYYATDKISGKKPFFNSYEDFAEDIRGLGKGYSILPEFKISDHMDYYVQQKEGNFLARNDAYLSLPGAAYTSSAQTKKVYTGARDQLFTTITRTAGFNENFFVEYSHSDFLEYFSTFKDDHQDVGGPRTYSFTVKGVKKLLPYKGFYPHERALQLGTLLSQSYASALTGTYPLGSPDHAATIGLNAFLKPIISPGVIFNSLKSSLAVDYPVFTGSLAGMNTGLDTDGRIYWNTAFRYRLPFETAIEPHAYFPISSSTTLKDLFLDEPVRIGSSLYQTSVAWEGTYTTLYTLAANNFFGEIPRFFLKDEKFTDFVSKPQSSFKSVEKDKYYYMDVVIKKSDDMVLCEGQAQVGAAPYSGSNERGIIYGPPVSSAWGESVNGSHMKDPAYAPYTPPYFYEKSIARILYIPAESGQPDINDILSQAKLETVYSGSSIELGLDDLASSHKMRISASVNLFSKSRYKKVTYNTNTGPDGNYIPTTLEDTDSFAFDAWSIGAKFECPALNFSASTDYHNSTTGRGIWGGYGALPTGSTGVFMELRESFPQTRGTGLLANTGSLIDICGFKAANKKIGKPAQQKTISEAIVAIPFISSGDIFTNQNPPLIEYPNTYKKFFKVHKHFFNTAVKESNEGTPPEDAKSFSITDMVVKMQKYNLPPQFDFLTFKELNPFVMYIFEFEHSLTQQDLTDIWQGLMPEISRTAQLDEASITHPALPREFFGTKPIPPSTRWMIFKVKKKAEKSYFAVTADSEDDSRFKFQFGNQEKAPEYSYNWPYDFFSLVELAKIDVSVDFRPPLGPGDNPADIIPE